MAGSDFQRVKRLGRYLGRDRQRLTLTLVLLIPVALAGAIQPLLVGQAIAVLRWPVLQRQGSTFRQFSIRITGN